MQDFLFGWVFPVAVVVLAVLAQRYKSERDDLAAWVQFNHPEDLREDSEA